MKSAGRKQSSLPLPDFSRKIKGDSARRVSDILFKNLETLLCYK